MASSKVTSTLASIAESGDHKYSRSYTNLLYRIGISPINQKATIPSDLEGTEEVRKYFPVPKDLPSLSSFMKSRFEKFQPNEASLVHFLCECLFPLKVSTSDEDNFAILLEFPGPFKSHSLRDLERGDEGIQYPMIKRNPSQEVMQLLQTPAEEDLRSRSDFVFAASTCCLAKNIRRPIQFGRDIPCVSNNGLTCAVAIVAEVKSNSSKASLAAAQNQWNSLAYLQIMERVSIRREAPYVGDKNICPNGYCICGLNIELRKMSIKWNSGERRASEVRSNYFTFPVQQVDMFSLAEQEDLERFVAIHQKLLHWLLNGYLPSYKKDITSIADLHPQDPELGKITWQEAAENLSPDSRGKPDILMPQHWKRSQPGRLLGSQMKAKHKVSRSQESSQSGHLLGPQMKGKHKVSQLQESSQPGHQLGPQMKAKIMLSLQNIYNQFIGLSSSF